MFYSEIIQRAMDKLYENDNDYPRNISFPIYYTMDNKTYDLLFFVENESDKNANEVPLKTIFLQNINNLDECFVYNNKRDIELILSNDMFEGCADDINVFCSFSSLYLSVREFVFTQDVTEEQRKQALQMASFYLTKLDKDYADLYRRISPGFFIWVYSLKN